MDQPHQGLPVPAIGRDDHRLRRVAIDQQHYELAGATARAMIWTLAGSRCGQRRPEIETAQDPEVAPGESGCHPPRNGLSVRILALTTPTIAADDVLAYVTVSPERVEKIALATFQRQFCLTQDSGQNWQQIA